MKKTANTIIEILLVAVGAYIAFFMLWAFLITGCVYSETKWDQCGNNTMTDIVRVAYPFFR